MHDDTPLPLPGEYIGRARHREELAEECSARGLYQEARRLAPRVLTKRQQEVLTQVENGINPYFTARAYGSSFHQMMWRIRDLMAWRKKQWVLTREGRAVLKQARR